MATDVSSGPVFFTKKEEDDEKKKGKKKGEPSDHFSFYEKLCFTVKKARALEIDKKFNV